MKRRNEKALSQLAKPYGFGVSSYNGSYSVHDKPLQDYFSGGIYKASAAEAEAFIRGLNYALGDLPKSLQHIESMNKAEAESAEALAQKYEAEAAALSEATSAEAEAVKRLLKLSVSWKKATAKYKRVAKLCTMFIHVWRYIQHEDDYSDSTENTYASLESASLIAEAEAVVQYYLIRRYNRIDSMNKAEAEAEANSDS